MSDESDTRRPPESEPPADDARELASYIRHELRTPLNQIIGYSQMLREEAEDEGLVSFQDDLGRIESAGSRLLALIDKLLDPDALRKAGIHRSTVEDEEPVDEAVADDETTELPAPAEVSGSILVVDDNDANRDMLARRLSRRGYTTLTASGGREAIAAIESETPDLVLLDVMMPEVNGLDVLRHVRETRSVADLPIIMATAKNASDDIVEALHSGANDYVTKPLDFNVVVARVETQLSLKRANDTVRRLYSELEEAQSRIAKLMSSGVALDDIPTWAHKVSSELATLIGVDEIGVFVLEQGDLRPTGKTATSPPDMRALVSAAAAHACVRDDTQTATPATGMSGAVLGTVVVPRRDLTEPEERMIASFAHQLGGALELQKTRSELAQAEARAERRRQELLDQGIDLLHVCAKCGSCYDQKTSTCPHDGRSVEAFRLLPYRVMGRYQLVSVLGQGGMGTVFRARDTRLERDVAVKVINPEHFRNPDVRARFEQEARALAKIDHPGVIAIHDSGDLEDGSGFLVMEMLEGFDVAQAIRMHGPGTPQQVAVLLREGAAALAAAHRAGLVHRDIKPANLYLTPTAGSFRVKILDFGIAKPLDLETNLTRTGAFVGTPAYMPPEQMSGLPVDARCDVYSFAASIYEALTGRRVTTKTDLANILMDVAMNEPPPVSEFLDGAPVEVDAAFRAGLSKRRETRPDDIEAWALSCADALDRTPSPRPGWQMTSRDATPSRTREGTVVPVTKVDSEAQTVTPSVDETEPLAEPTFEQNAPTTPIRDERTVVAPDEERTIDFGPEERTKIDPERDE
jgi:serine/threonine protein kinase/CheY-like chemotaxis protein